MCHTASIVLHPDLRAPADLRRWLDAVATTAFMQPQSLIDDLQLVGTELATNALRAGARLLSARLVCCPNEMELSVVDDASGEPDLQTAAPSHSTGRGLAIVEALTSEWGCRIDDPAPGQKRVWGRMKISRSAQPTFPWSPVGAAQHVGC